MDRRTFISYLGAGSAAAMLPRAAAAATSPFRAVIIGGGMAGATAAKYLRLWSGGAADVTLVDGYAAYTSCIMSNKVLTGQRSLSSLVFNYGALTSKYGVKFIKATATAIDRANKKVTLSNNQVLVFDRLILATGIDFNYAGIAGLEGAAERALVPHAWKAGTQTNLLRNQLFGMADGSNFILTIPKPPYRCPPGPYERACVVADWMKSNKPRSKLLVLDANVPAVPSDPYTAIQAEPINFTNAFKNIHRNIAYHSNVSVASVDTGAKKISTSLGQLNYGVLNLIPPQKAAPLIFRARLNNGNPANNWAGVNVLSYESTVAPGIHIIGDSASTTQPKAGHIGNQEAKVCADAIIRLQSGLQPDPSPVTNSACYTPITATTATWLTAVFAYDPNTASMKVVGGKAAEPLRGPSTKNYEQMEVWFRTLMADTFA